MLTYIRYQNGKLLKVNFFSKSHCKKVLLHTAHCEKLSYVVISNVADFFEQCLRDLPWGIKRNRNQTFCFPTFHLAIAAARCELLFFDGKTFTKKYTPKSLVFKFTSCKCV